MVYCYRLCLLLSIVRSNPTRALGTTYIHSIKNEKVEFHNVVNSLHSGANPTTGSYNANVVNIYKQHMYCVLRKKIIFPYCKNALVYYNAAVVVVNFRSLRKALVHNRYVVYSTYSVR
jgi:hypothetical protein